MNLLALPKRLLFFASIMVSTLLLTNFITFETAAAQTTIFQDDFSASTLDPAWTVRDGKGTYSLTESPGHLKLTLSNNGEQDTGNAVRLSRSFSGEHWVFETKVDYDMSSTGTQQGRQQYLVITWPGSEAVDPYVNWRRDKDCCSSPSRDELAAIVVNADGSAERINLSPNASDAYYLRIIRAGQIVTLQQRGLNEANFTTVAEHTYTTSLGSEQTVQLFSTSHSSESSSAEYDYIEVTDLSTASGDAAISISPSTESVAVGAETTAEIQVDNISDLYGAQLELSFDPALLEVVDAYDTVTGIQIEDGDFLNPDTTIHNAVDNGAGTIQYTVSLQGDKPGVSGSGVLARIRFRGLAVGTSAIDLVNVVLSDPNSRAIQSSQSNGQIEVNNVVQVSGRVLLERRTSNAGVEVCVAALCTTSAADGSYVLTNLPSSGTVQFVMQGYLRAEVAYSDVSGPDIVLADTTLLGGDVNQDDIIDITDATLIGQAWNGTPSDGHWDARADITNDGVVNILDMVAVQNNWQQSFVAANVVAANVVTASAIQSRLAFPPSDLATPLN